MKVIQKIGQKTARYRYSLNRFCKSSLLSNSYKVEFPSKDFSKLVKDKFKDI